jgi:polysaccharide deacetylase 2 family uncharacterized protein YibQ
VARERHRNRPTPAVAWVGDATIQPAARATGPGVSADGAIHIAATLLDSVAPKVAIAKAMGTESPGTSPSAPPATPSRTMPAATEQVASLTPMERPAAPTAAWRLYGHHMDTADTRPHIALIVAGDDDNMDGALATLPAAVTLALDPYARRLPEWIERARTKGHEVLLTLSAPPVGHDRENAGPMAILSSLDPKENLERLDWALDRATGFVGVVDIVGNRPAAETGEIVARLRRRGLMLVSGTALQGGPPTVPTATSNIVLSPNLSRRQVEQKLAELQAEADRDGHAVGIAIVNRPLLHYLATWLAGLANQSIALAPATAMIAADAGTGIAKATGE